MGPSGIFLTFGGTLWNFLALESIFWLWKPPYWLLPGHKGVPAAPVCYGTRSSGLRGALTPRGTRAAWYRSPRSAHLRPVRLFLLPVAYQAWMACPRPRRLGADLGDVLGPKTGVFRLGTSGSDVRRVPASRLAIHKLALVFKTFETFETFHVRHVAWLRGQRLVPDNLRLK